MAITPIDLQAIFSQVDKVAKTQLSQREGIVLQQSMQGVQLQRKAEEQTRQVNQTQNTGDEAEKVKDHPAVTTDQQKKQKKKRGRTFGNTAEEIDKDKEMSPSFFDDPNMGKNIDISL